MLVCGVLRKSEGNSGGVSAVDLGASYKATTGWMGGGCRVSPCEATPRHRPRRLGRLADAWVAFQDKVNVTVIRRERVDCGGCQRVRG